MGLFDSIQNLIGGAAGDVLGGLPEVPGVQEIQDIAGGETEAFTTATEGATEAVTSVTEQGQTLVEDITSKLGL